MRGFPRRRAALGLTVAVCGLAVVLASAMAFGEQGSAALGPSNGRYIGEISLGFGQEGVTSLDVAEYSVLGQPLCRESEAYLGYKRSEAGITDLVLSGVNGTVAVDGREYEQVQELDVFDGLKGSGYLYASHDAASGSPIVSVTVESASEFEDEPIFALNNDGTSPMRDDGGQVADLGVDAPAYLFMLRENVCRPYVGEARLVTGTDLCEAVLAAANAGFDYYWDAGLSATDGSYAVIGYNRTGDEAEAIRCITARPSSEESYTVGDVQFEPMGDAAIDSEVPYRLFFTRDTSAGNPILDFAGSGAHDVGTMGQWAERTFVKFASALSAQEAKSESTYVELAKDDQPLTCVPVILGDADVVYEAAGAVLQNDTAAVQTGDGTAGETGDGTDTATADAQGARPEQDREVDVSTGDASELLATNDANGDGVDEGQEGEPVPQPANEGDASSGLGEQGRLYLETQGIIDLSTTGEDVPAPQEEPESEPEVEAGSQEIGRETAPEGSTRQTSEAPQEKAEPTAGNSPVEERAGSGDGREGDLSPAPGEDEARPGEDAASEDEDEKESAYRGIVMPLGYVCAKNDLPVSLFAQSEQAKPATAKTEGDSFEARSLDGTDSGEAKTDTDEAEANKASDTTSKPIVESMADSEAAVGGGQDSEGVRGELSTTGDGDDDGLAIEITDAHRPVQEGAGSEGPSQEGTGAHEPTQEGAGAEGTVQEGASDEGVSGQDTSQMVDNPSESYQDFLDAYNSNVLMDDFNQDTYLDDEATSLAGEDEGQANTHAASVFGGGAAEGVAAACGMGVVGAAIGYGCFHFRRRRSLADRTSDVAKGGGEDE